MSLSLSLGFISLLDILSCFIDATASDVAVIIPSSSSELGHI